MFVPSRHYDSQSGTKFYDYSNDSPYDNFMRKHLQHYGYYTGKNDKRIKSLESWQEPEAGQPDYKEYGCEDDYLNEALKTKERSEKELNSNQVVYNVNDGKVITKLKEPRALFSIASDPGFHSPKWPIELEVLPDRVTHIDDFPGPEPFNHPTGFEPCPTILGEEGGGRLVFSYEPVISPFFIKSRVGGSKTLTNCQVRLESESDDTLMFESRFECGNLRKVYQVAPTDYELWLRTDLYTSKHTQWFYFRVSNTRPGQLYRFTLVNFYKSASLYSEGLRPLMYSEKSAAAENGRGWRRCGGNIKYFRSNKRYSSQSGDRYYYSLTWQIRFDHSEDTVYFAHCYPYTYSDLVDYLQKLQDDPVKSQFCKQRVLCRSLAGNAVHLLTIGGASGGGPRPPPLQPQQLHTQEEPELLDQVSAPGAAAGGGGKPAAPPKKVILVTSRVHPGESNASWMMKGFLDFITGDSPDARLLRDCFTFKVVPMINPDGVIVGNYRCSLTGRDLNRNYKTLLKDSFPAVYAIVELVRKLQSTPREVALYCDLHGHSRRQNVFIYGCENKDSKDKERLFERVFPAMMSKNAPDKFSYECCKFRMQKSKEGTGRMVMYNLGVKNSFTMEATFCGSTLGGLKGQHFHYRHLEAMGAHLCDTLLDYFDPNPAKVDSMLLQVEHKLKEQILVNMQRSGRCVTVVNVDELNLSEISDEDVESSDGGSDSSASNGLPVHYEFMKSQLPPDRKKKRRSRKERGGAAVGGAKKPSKPPHSDCIPSDTCVPERRSMCPHNTAGSSALTAAAAPGKQPQQPLTRKSATASAAAAVALSAPPKAPPPPLPPPQAESGASCMATRSASTIAACAPATGSASAFTVKQKAPPPQSGFDRGFRLKSVASEPNMQPVQTSSVGPQSVVKDATAAAGELDRSAGTPLCARHHHQLADFDRITGQQLLQGRVMPNDASNLLRIFSYQRTNAVAHNYTLETIEYMLAARDTEQRQMAEASGSGAQQQQQLLHRRTGSTNQIGTGTMSMAQTGQQQQQLEPLQTSGNSRSLLASRLRLRGLGGGVGGSRGRQQLPNRRMHSASPSYPAHSVPVQIAPEDRHAYQLEWSLSQQPPQRQSDGPMVSAIDNSGETSSAPPLQSRRRQSGGDLARPLHHPQMQHQQHEIAQTASQPTVALSSSSKPPLPSLSTQPTSSGQTTTTGARPAMINLHMASSSGAAAGGQAASMAVRRGSVPVKSAAAGHGGYRRQ